MRSFRLSAIVVAVGLGSLGCGSDETSIDVGSPPLDVTEDTSGGTVTSAPTASSDPLPSDTVTTTIATVTTTTLPAPDDGPATLADLVGADVEPVTWRPVLFDGEDLLDGSRLRWRFSDDPDGFFVTGFDGCNAFSDSFDPESGMRAQLIDGVLTDLEMSSDEAACPDQTVFGPTPQEGDRLMLVDGGAGLDVVRDGVVQIELVREP